MRKFSAMLGAAILGSALTFGTLQFMGHNEASSGKVEVAKIPTVNTNYTAAIGNLAAIDFTAPAEAVMPAVVHIRSTQTGRSGYDRQQQIPEAFRDFFGPFLREERGNGQPRMGSGSGVIISADGYIVTNNHVIDNADELLVTLNDNRSYKANVIGTDPTTDIALIKIAQGGLTNLALFNSDEVKVGEWVLAVGNPFNLNSTVTAGIVSAKGRNIGIIGDSTSIESFIQTDAAVNPGNSGGALVNLSGQLIGINTAIASPTGAYSGYSFAVPSNIVAKVVEDLMTYGVVQRGWLGVQIQNINSDVVKERGLRVNEGALVAAMPDNSSAKEAGVKVGDVIVAVDGTNVRTTSHLIGYVGSKRPGDQVTLKVNRDGRNLELPVVLKNREGNTKVVKKEREEILTVLGVDLADVDAATLNEVGAKSGVLVKALRPGKIRKETNMREGFIITKIDGNAVRDKEDVIRILETKKGGILIEGKYPGEARSYYYGIGL